MNALVKSLAIGLTALFAAALIAPAAQAAPVPAWAPLAASGPTNLTPVQSEISRLQVDATEGTFTLSARTFLAKGTVASLGAHISAVFITEEEGAFGAGQEISGEYFAPGTKITGSFGSGVYFISQPTTNSSTASNVKVEGSEHASTTAALPFAAERSTVESELNGLSAFEGAGASVSVSGGPGGEGAELPYFISFEGSAAGVNLPAVGQPLLEADGSGLSGGVNTGARLSTALNGGPGTTEIAIYPQNVGGAPSTGPVELHFELPAGITTTETPNAINFYVGAPWSCAPTGAGQSEGTCTIEEAAQPGITLNPLVVPVAAGVGAESGIVHIEVSGGGAPVTGEYDMPLVVSAIPAPPGIQAFNAATYRDDGAVDTRAGAHPYAGAAGILVNTVRGPLGDVVPAGEFRDIVVNTPPGFLGNPTAAASCKESSKQKHCDPRSILATAQVGLSEFGGQGETSTVVNVKAPRGYPAKFRFPTGGGTEVINVVAHLRSDEDYGIELGSYNTPQILPVFGSFFTIWGTPSAAGHDAQRCQSFEQGGPEEENCMTNEEILAAGGKEVAFLSNPVDCAEEATRPPSVTLNANLWQNPGLTFTSHASIPAVTGCDALHFEGGLALNSSGSAADSPESFTTSLTTPTEGLTDPEQRINPTIEKTVVQLPAGVSLNPSGADGLAACTESQIGYKGGNFDLPNPMRFDKQPNTCPDASKIGSGTLHTPLIEGALNGDLYLAAQGSGNPFGSTFAVYLAIEDPSHGITIKLPGKVETDPSSGQITVTFEHLPPYPVESLDLTLKGGERSALASPQTCGTYTTRTTFTPWSAPESGPPTVSTSDLKVDSGPNGSPCANTKSAQPFGLGFDAGTTDPVAGAHSPFAMRLTRPDGAQDLNRFALTTPEGFTATLKGIPYCSDADLAHAAANDGRAEQASPSCPEASQIGTTTVGAGAGPHPFYVDGKVYLAGPYKGAQLSVAAIVPAVAGPFDLGTQVVRAALLLNPATAQVTTVTDALPKLLKGVPLRIRDVRVKLDKPGFTLNPTDCSEMQVSAKAFGAGGATSEPANRFQVGGCGALGFKPRFFTRLYGGVHRGDFPRFRAVYVPKAGNANLKDLVLRFPRSEFIEQGHFRTICTRVQYNAGGGFGEQCPKGSIYGQVSAVTPLLDQPLSGPVYLRSSNHNLPDVVFALHGQVDAEASVRIDSVKGGLRARVENAPDVPLSKVIVNMQGRQKGLFVNSRNICSSAYRAAIEATAHNGRVSKQKPVLKNSKCHKARRHKKRHRRHHRHRVGHRAKR